MKIKSVQNVFPTNSFQSFQKDRSGKIRNLYFELLLSHRIQKEEKNQQIPFLLIKHEKLTYFSIRSHFKAHKHTPIVPSLLMAQNSSIREIAELVFKARAYFSDYKINYSPMKTYSSENDSQEHQNINQFFLECSFDEIPMRPTNSKSNLSENDFEPEFLFLNPPRPHPRQLQSQMNSEPFISEYLNNSIHHEIQSSSFGKIQEDQQMREEQPLNEIKFSKEFQQKRKKTLKGYRWQISNLSKHFKQVTLMCLDVLYAIHSLDEDEIGLVKKFKASNGSLSAFRQLYSNQGLRRKTSEYFSSSFFVKDVLKSSRMIQNKISMIRHLNVLSKFRHGASETWKCG